MSRMSPSPSAPGPDGAADASDGESAFVSCRDWEQLQEWQPPVPDWWYEVHTGEEGPSQDWWRVHVDGARDSAGCSLLHHAAEGCKVEAGQLLLQYGADPSPLDSKRNTPLHVAAERGFSAFVRLLLEYGADPNARDLDGWAPLHLLANQSFYAANLKECAAALVYARANINLLSYSQAAAVASMRSQGLASPRASHALLTSLSHNSSHLLADVGDAFGEESHWLARAGWTPLHCAGEGGGGWGHGPV